MFPGVEQLLGVSPEDLKFWGEVGIVGLSCIGIIALVLRVIGNKEKPKSQARLHREASKNVEAPKRK